MTDPVIYEKHGRVAAVVFNRPERLNAIDPSLAEGVLAAVKRAIADPDVRVVTFAGKGKAFMAGGDLAFFRDAGLSAGEEANRLIGPLHEAIQRLSDSRLISIAALHGAVAGGGMSLALATDLAVCADDTRFNLSYLNVAATPDCAGSWNLVRHLGLRRALGIALLGSEVSAIAAFDLGLVNLITPTNELIVRTTAIADQLASGPGDAIAATKTLLRAAGDRSLSAQLAAEAQAFSAGAAGADFREAIGAFFEKRIPKFK